MGKITDIGNINKINNAKPPVKKKKTGEFGKLLNEKMDKSVKSSDTTKTENIKKTELSPEDKKIVDKALKDTPDVRAEKIAEIKEKIANGTYNIDSKTLADAMLKKGFKP